MKKELDKSLIKRFSRQIILKDIGIPGQKKIFSSKVLIVGLGGLGSPAAEFLVRAGIGKVGIVDFDKVDLSNLHRQTLYEASDVGKYKVEMVKKKLKKINSKTIVKVFNLKINKNNIKSILKEYEYIVDGSDNFETKFLLNDFCLRYKKFLVTGAISKFDGHIFTFDFKNEKIPCLRCFYQENKIKENLTDCESEGVIGTVPGLVGTIQANEILKQILNIGKSLDNFILILDLLNLDFRKVRINKKKLCLCN